MARKARLHPACGYTHVSHNTGTDSFYLSTSLIQRICGEYTHSNLSGSRATSGDLVFTVPNDDTNATLTIVLLKTPSWEMPFED